MSARALPAALAAVVLAAGCGGAAAEEAGTVEIGTARAVAADPRGGGLVVGTPAVDPTPPAAVGALPSCSGTEVVPSPANVAAAARAVLCLANAERTSRGLRPLRANALLARAALGHARDMVAHSYFSHTSRSGATLVTRVRRAGYVRGAGRWGAGENLAWGEGPLATPREIHRAWMSSPGHRANILNGGFRELGIGIATGTPRSAGAAGATFVTAFGARA